MSGQLSDRGSEEHRGKRMSGRSGGRGGARHYLACDGSGFWTDGGRCVVCGKKVVGVLAPRHKALSEIVQGWDG